MADRIFKPDTGNDLVLQNNGGTAKIEINDGQEITITIGSSSGDDFNVGSGKLLIEGDTSLVSITGDFKVGGNNIEDSGGVVALTFDGSGNTNLSDKILQRPTIKDYSETGNAIGDTGASQTIDLTAGNVITATLAVATTTFTFSNPSASGSCCSFTLILTQDGSGSRAVTWPGSVQWASSTAPTLSTGAADVDIFAFLTIDAGTTWFGFTGGLDMDI
jgi:molybdopterin-binding protein